MDKTKISNRKTDQERMETQKETLKILLISKL